MINRELVNLFEKNKIKYVFDGYNYILKNFDNKDLLMALFLYNGDIYYVNGIVTFQLVATAIKFECQIPQNVDILKLLEGKYFIGGSTRFKYKDPSDLDIFANLSNLDFSDVLMLLISKIGINHQAYVINSFTFSFENKIDLTVFVSDEEYTRCKNEHFKIEAYLNKLNDTEREMLYRVINILSSSVDRHNVLKKLALSSVKNKNI